MINRPCAHTTRSVLSTTHNFLFVHVPKTGGNSIQSVLAPYADDAVVREKPHQDGVERFAVRSTRFDTRKHSTLAEYRAAYGEPLFQSLQKVCGVRNPWDRVVSHYFSRTRRVSSERRGDFLEFIRSPVVRPLEHFLTINEGDTRDLGRAVSRLSCVIRYEQLQPDFDRACDLIGLPHNVLPHRNRGLHRPYEEYYDEECRRAVAERFQGEIMLFGYSFGG
jgi:hypothetical protein